MVLEGLSYFQKSGELVDSYVDRFRELSKRAELVDACTLVIKLCRGLLLYIAEALTDSSNPPASNNMEQWIKQARNFERSCQLQKNLARTKLGFPRLACRTPSQPSANDLAICMPHPAPHSVSNPIRPAGFLFAPKPPIQMPMDVDAARARSWNADVCQQCRQAGHWTKDCSKAYDVRFMFANELEEYLALARDRTDLAEAQGASGEGQGRGGSSWRGFWCDQWMRVTSPLVLHNRFSCLEVDSELNSCPPPPPIEIMPKPPELTRFPPKPCWERNRVPCQSTISLISPCSLDLTVGLNELETPTPDLSSILTHLLIAARPARLLTRISFAGLRLGNSHDPFRS